MLKHLNLTLTIRGESVMKKELLYATGFIFTVLIFVSLTMYALHQVAVGSI